MAKNILITGTRKGIGQALAKAYLAEGHNVIGCSRKEASLTHVNYTHFVLDISDEKAVLQMFRQIKKFFNKLDVLINNAGIAAMNHSLTTTCESVNALFSTNVLGTFLFSREAAKMMMRQKNGRIVNYTSVASAISLEGEAVYAASKSAVESLTKTMAKELGSLGITVNAIGPTPVATDLIKSVPKDKIQALIDHQAIKRMGEFKDIKQVVDFFIDEKSNFITGQIIYLGGIVK